MRAPISALAVLALAAFAAGCGGGSKHEAATPAASPPQTLQVVAKAHSIAAPGASSLHAGLVTLHVRDASALAHGIGVIRLAGTTTPAQAKKIVGGDTIPDKLPFSLLGGVPQLDPGGTWTGTIRLTPGRYLLFDDGENQKGMELTFTVPKGATEQAAPPKTVGTVTMTDYAFGIDLPADWDGRGIVKVPNLGKEIHELTFVKFGSAAELQQFRAILAKGYPQGPPPKDARIVYAVGGTSPGHTTYVRLDLTPGRYLAVCLFPDAKSGKPHTALGMMSTLTVH
jgi:hypothetical protein